MAKYRKFMVAAVGAVMVGLNTFLGVEMPFAAEGVVNTVITMLVAAGVYELPNDEA